MKVVDKFGREIKQDDFLIWASSNCLYVGQVLSTTPLGSVIVVRYDTERHESGLELHRVSCKRPWEAIATDSWPLSGAAFNYLRKQTL